MKVLFDAIAVSDVYVTLLLHVDVVSTLEFSSVELGALDCTCL